MTWYTDNAYTNTTTAPANLTVSGNNLASGTATITMTENGTTVTAGTYYFTISVGGMTARGTLQVDA